MAIQKTPIFQLPYPEPGDHTRTWEYWQALAEAVEAALAPLVAGQLAAIAGVAAASGWTVDARGVKLGKYSAYVLIKATRTGAAIGPGSATGNVTDTQICTLPAGWRPAQDTAVAFAGAGNAAAFVGLINTVGVTVVAGFTNATITIATNDVVTIACTLATA